MTSITVDSLQVLITANAKDLDAKLSNIANQLGDTGKSADKFSKMGTLAFGAVAGAAAALANKGINAITNSIDGAIKRVDTLNNAPKVLQNLGFSAEESARAIKLIDQGVQGLPTSLDDIASSLVAIASSSGLSIDKATDLTVAFNNMALAGGKGPAEAQRALVQFTQALGRGKFQAQDFNTLMEVMPAQLNQVAKTLLGASANSGQLRDALTSGEISMSQFNDAVIGLNKEGGANFASFADQAKTATGGIATGWSLVQTAITRGIASIISAVGSANITAAFGNLRNAVDTTFKAISGFITFIITHKGIFLPLAVGIGTAVAAVTAWHLAITVATAAQAAFNAVLLLNPIGIVIAAIAALVAGLIYLWNTSDGFRNFFIGMWGAIVTAVQPVIDIFNAYLLPALQMVWGFIVNQFQKAWEDLKKAYEQIKQTLQPYIDQMKGPLMEVLKAVGIAIAVAVIAPLVLLGAAIVAVVTVIAVIVSAIARFIGWIANLYAELMKVGNLVAGHVANSFSNAWSKIVGVWSAAVGFFSGVASGIVNHLSSLPAKMKEQFDKAVAAIKSIDWGGIGMDIIRGIGNGIAGMGKWLAQKAVEAVNGAKEAIKNFFGIHSPSTVMRDEVGKMIGAGMAIGIDDSSKDVMSSMKDLANVSMGSFDSSVSVQHGFSDFTDSGNAQPLIINVGGERLVDTVIQGINGRSFLGGSSVINV